ncbi:MAG: hypothetical protein Q4B26_15110 [Eubacteriales bacterium]|nr:hypothetical protein [Eubacteriales bacterium]
MQFRRKPVTVDAFRLDANVELNAPRWFIKEVEKEKIYIDRRIRDGAVHIYGCTIEAKSGRQKAKIGDYIILEPSGAIRPCKAAEFKKEYERL